MTAFPRFGLIDHRQRNIAERMHAVLRPAYAQEAALLGLADFPPMRRTVAELQAHEGLVWGAWVGDELAGVLCMAPDEDEAPQLVVTMLIVHPDHQRRGLARGLMQRALQASGPQTLAVATAEANVPAVTLYRSLGFQIYRRGLAEPGPVAMVKLRHLPRAAAATDAGSR